MPLYRFLRLCLALACLPVPALHAGSPAAPDAVGSAKLLVLECVVPPGLPAEASGLVSDYVLQSLAETQRFTLVDRRNLAALLAEQEFRLSGLVSDAEANRAAALAGADLVAVPRLARMGDSWYLSLRLIEVDTGIVRSQATVERRGDLGVLPGMGGEAGRLAAGDAAPSAPAVIRGPAQTLSLVVMDSSPQAQAVIEDALGRFRKLRPELSFKLSYASEFDTALRDRILAGQGPDLIWQLSNQLPIYAAAKAIMPLEGLDKLPGYDPAAAAVSRFQGKNYGVTVSLGDHLFLAWRRDLIAAPPQSMEELLKQAPALLAQGIKPMVWNTGDAFVFSAWLAAQETNYLDRNGGFALIPGRVKKALELYRKHLDALGLKAGMSEDQAIADFKEGRAAIYLTGDWSLSWLYAPDSKLRPVLGVAPLPSLGKQRLAGYVSGRSLMARSGLSPAQEGAAREFMDLMVSAPVQRAMLFYLNRLPVNTDPSLQRVLALDPVYQGVAKALSLSQPALAARKPFFADLSWALGEFISGRKGLDEASELYWDIAAAKLRN